ncbi:methionine ABC transporter ATP-binding protein [Clostridium ihumii]|uniref:methionine ABC transporter ATP-binding protein n=1 Tax=Clostridium ihumii TaxID=1470356 RepID=UPI000552329D|nr:ATP-binding cassette domain-containing protein [Clostridium ihumii]
MITIKNLTKIYNSKNSNVIAVDNLNLKVNEGDIYGIIGLSGAGKSSLLRCINLLEKPTKGEVLLDNLTINSTTHNIIDITKLSSNKLREVRKQIGIIFQHFNLLMNSTVYDNIAFPLKLNKVPKLSIDKKVNELLELVDLKEKKYFYPSQLSGGQKQRVGIARCLSTNPKIILCDEATSALDPSTTDSILNLLKLINKKFNITIVLITHEMDVIKKICNKVAVMQDGKIVEEGLVLDVFSNPKTEISNSFFDKNLSIPNSLKDKFYPNIMLKLTFKGISATSPVIHELSKKFEVEFNIICGCIDVIQETQVGSLIITLNNDLDTINSITKFLKSMQVEVEVINFD